MLLVAFLTITLSEIIIGDHTTDSGPHASSKNQIIIKDEIYQGFQQNGLENLFKTNNKLLFKNCSFINFSGQFKEAIISVTLQRKQCKLEIFNCTFFRCSSQGPYSILKLRNFENISISNNIFGNCLAIEKKESTLIYAANTRYLLFNDNYFYNISYSGIIHVGEECTEPNVTNCSFDSIEFSGPPTIKSYSNLTVANSSFDQLKGNMVGIKLASVALTILSSSFTNCDFKEGLLVGSNSKNNIILENSKFENIVAPKAIVYILNGNLHIYKSLFYIDDCIIIKSDNQTSIHLQKSVFSHCNNVSKRNKLVIESNLEIIIDNETIFLFDRKFISPNYNIRDSQFIINDIEPHLQKSDGLYHKKNIKYHEIGSSSDMVSSNLLNANTQPIRTLKDILSNCDNNISSDFDQMGKTYEGKECKSYFVKISGNVANIHLQSCSFNNYGNNILENGCISIANTSKVTKLEIINCSFVKCVCNSAGAALYANNVDLLTINNCLFTDCEIFKYSEVSEGCAVSINANCLNITVNHNNFDHCIGGCLMIWKEPNVVYSMFNNTFARCVNNVGQTVCASACFIVHIRMTIEECRFYDNVCDCASAIYQLDQNILTMNRVEVIGNHGKYVAKNMVRSIFKVNECYFSSNNVSCCFDIDAPGVGSKFNSTSFISDGSTSIFHFDGKLTIQYSCFTFLPGVTKGLHINETTRRVMSMTSNQFQGTEAENWKVVVIPVSGFEFVSSLKCPRYLVKENDEAHSEIFDAESSFIIEESPFIESDCGMKIVSRNFERIDRDFDGSECFNLFTSFDGTIANIHIEGCCFKNFGSNNIENGCIIISNSSKINSVEIIDCSFAKCVCNSAGAALYANNVDLLIVNNCSFTDCEIFKYSEVSEGCAVSINANCLNITVNHNNFDHCIGGCLMIWKEPNVVHSMFNNTFARCVNNVGQTVCASACFIVHIRMTIEECRFYDNVCDCASAIYQLDQNILTMNRVEVTGNHGKYVAKNQDPSIFKVNECYFSNNNVSCCFYIDSLGSGSKFSSTSFISGGSTSIVFSAGKLTIEHCCFSFVPGVKKGIHIESSISKTIFMMDNEFEGDISTNWNISSLPGSGFTFMKSLKCPRYLVKEEEPSITETQAIATMKMTTEIPTFSSQHIVTEEKKTETFGIPSMKKTESPTISSMKRTESPSPSQSFDVKPSQSFDVKSSQSVDAKPSQSKEMIITATHSREASITIKFIISDDESNEGTKEKKFEVGQIIGISIGAIVVVILIIAMIMLLKSKKKRKTKSIDRDAHGSVVYSVGTSTNPNLLFEDGENAFGLDIDNTYQSD